MLDRDSNFNDARRVRLLQALLHHSSSVKRLAFQAETPVGCELLSGTFVAEIENVAS
jgi:hypothetical protein